ncbi:MAG: hypothetical protein A2270_03040 [Elusimicrobia bacterium RIFOXYA12_FULL_51_18]|nr:MAG: hypothetical protein A2270_03040 [Elusimicrobia bacterium RIFOXYA12_FULL_51_18]OGS28378.1 MAG: hypothetical protein A2218_06850 [Elusimicrobia bacterium RIFOXYA2_FULL_53_38]
MEPIDTNYLSLQFRDRIYKGSGNSFQGLFEEIMQKALQDFQKVHPYGNKGDGGNDGYQPAKGTYYQVYAPKNPSEKTAAAAKKLKNDFEKLHATWDQISKIKVFYFAFNDKFTGTNIEIEQALAELKGKFSGIEFKVFLSQDLERVFFSLKTEQMLALGFDVNQVKPISVAQEALEVIEGYIDRDNGGVALQILEQFRGLIGELNNERLTIDSEILEGKALERLERVPEAKQKYEHLCARYPNSPEAFLYLAAIYLQSENLETNLELLKQAESISPDYWFLTIQKLLRALRLDEKIDISQIDEQSFPDDFRAKSTFYRIYSIFLTHAGNTENALRFINTAISLNPERITNHIAKISTLEAIALFSDTDRTQLKANAATFLNDIEAAHRIIAEHSGCTPRNIAIIEYKKITALFVLENYSDAIQSARNFLGQIPKCYFDYSIDRLLAELLLHIQISSKDFDIILTRLSTENKIISDPLSKAILLQFSRTHTLFTDGKKFFTALKGQGKILDFINKLKSSDYDNAWNYLKEDVRFAVIMATAAKDLPDLRKTIIEKLPNDGNIQKQKLLLLLNYDQENIDEAFELLKQMNFAELGYLECQSILKIAQKKEAWDFEARILGKLLTAERNPEIISQLKLKLFGVNLRLKRLPEAIQIGEQLLSEDIATNKIEENTREEILGQTILARLNRGEFNEAKLLLLKYPQYSNTPEFKVAVEAEVYIKNGDGQSALNSIITAVKALKTPTPEQYGGLILTFISVSNLINLNLGEPLPESIENSYVKLKTVERWYYLGDLNELDATKVPKSGNHYSEFFNKRIGDKIKLKSKYQSESVELEIENILPIEKYVLWQCHHHAQKLTQEHRWKAMEIIEVPTIGDTIDPKYIIARLAEEHEAREPFFNFYCANNAPFAFLALNDGGVANALAHIVASGKGFINFSTGVATELEQQKTIARQVIDGDDCFLDGISALILAESGLGNDIFQYLPNLKIPQSVISMLFEIKEKYRYTPGQVGHLGYVNGGIRVSSIDSNKRELIQKNFERYIAFFESKPQNIYAISAATKQNHFIEQNIPPELCDACALARQHHAIVITEDYFYLQANELETKLSHPKHCSSFALIRTLYEQNKIPFEQYLNFFSYLTFYRFRFLPIHINDIENAVYGSGPIKLFQPERIRHLNFPLTLSKEYGVHPDDALRVTAIFLFRAAVNIAITPDMIERLFAEILSCFPTSKSKKAIGRDFMYALEYLANKVMQKEKLPSQIKDKLVRLSQYVEMYTDTTF